MYVDDILHMNGAKPSSNTVNDTDELLFLSVCIRCSTYPPYTMSLMGNHIFVWHRNARRSTECYSLSTEIAAI